MWANSIAIASLEKNKVMVENGDLVLTTHIIDDSCNLSIVNTWPLKAITVIANVVLAIW